MDLPTLPTPSLLISRERCLELSNWMNVYKMFAFTAQNVVIEVPQRRRIAYLKTFRKISHIKHIAIPMTRGSYKSHKIVKHQHYYPHLGVSSFSFLYTAGE